jgi:DNA-binding GntR family transcriptional regulator
MMQDICLFHQVDCATQSHGRIDMAPRRLVKTTLSEQTYEELKERILDQTLAPGERLNIDRLSRALNVSSSPIREALARLEGDRLVISQLYAGYNVAPQPDPNYLHDLLDLRILLEGHCAFIGAPKQNPAILQAMSQALRKLAATRTLGTHYREYRRFVQADHAFHQALVDSAENIAISQTYASLNGIITQSRLYLNRGNSGMAAAQVAEEHTHIFLAFKEGNGAAAREALRDHLERGRRRLLSVKPR